MRTRMNPMTPWPARVNPRESELRRRPRRRGRLVHLGLFGRALIDVGFIRARPGVVGFIRTRSDATRESFGFVGFIRARTGGRQVHSGSLGSFRHIVGFIWAREGCRWVNVGAP